MLLSLLQVNIGSTKGSCQDKQVSGGMGEDHEKEQAPWEEGEEDHEIWRKGGYMVLPCIP